MKPNRLTPAFRRCCAMILFAALWCIPVSAQDSSLPLKETWLMGSNHPNTTWSTDGTVEKEFLRGDMFTSNIIDLSKYKNPKLYTKMSIITITITIYQSSDGQNWDSGTEYQPSEYIDLKKTTKKIKLIPSRTTRLTYAQIFDFKEYSENDYNDYSKYILRFDASDYSNSEELPKDWKFENKDGSQCSVKYGSVQADIIETPLLDLSKCENPELTFSGDHYLYVSTDGINFTEEINVTKSPYKLSKDIKKIRFSKPIWTTSEKQPKLSSLEIFDYGNDYTIEESNGTLTYTKNLTVPDNAPYYNSYDNKIKYFSYSVPKDFFKYTYNTYETESEFQKIGDDWVKLPDKTFISVSPKATAIIVSTTSFEASCNRNITKFDDYPSQKPKVYSAPNQWYDINGDGRLEFFNNTAIYTTDSENRYYQIGEIPTSDKVWNGGKYTYKFTDLNGDGKVDFTREFESFLGNGDGSFFKEILQSDYDATKGGFLVGDADNDGQMELMCGSNLRASKAPDKYIKFDADGKGFSQPLNIFQPGNMGVANTTNPGADRGLPSLGTGMFVGGAVSTNTRTSAEMADITGDGLPDIITDQELLLATGDGSYAQQSATNITLRDFNGDGIIDYVGNDQSGQAIYVYIVQPNGDSPKEVKLMSGLVANSKIWCYDFDKDGDVDVLIPFDCRVAVNKKTHNNGGSYLLLAENNGDGTFKKHEAYIGEELFFKDCMDVNADGNYEVIYYDENTDKVSYIPIKGLTIDTTPAEIVERNVLSADVTAVNFYLDGKMYLNGLYGDLILISDAVNQRPTPPEKPEIYYDASKSQLQIRWGNGSDAESSAADLTYSMRIGSTPDGQDMMWADALSDGTRRNLMDGNMVYSHQRIIDVSSWKAGKYYISVQSIDPNRNGSKFSAAAVFDKTDDATAFEIYYNKPFAVGDTCIVKSKNANAQFDFGQDSEEIFPKNGKSGYRYVRYYSAGTKSIQQTSPIGTAQQIEVTPAKIIEGSAFPLEGSNEYSVYPDGSVFDFDEDGKIEFMSTSGLKSYFDNPWNMYQLNEHGIGIKIKKLWNTNPHGKIPTDLNMDGKVDLLGGHDRYGYVYDKIINEGEFNATMEEIPQYTIPSGTWLDFNNDGKLDTYPYSENSICLNNGDYTKFTTKELNIKHGISIDILDLNNDGLLDIISREEICGEDNYKLYANINNGNFTFTESELFGGKKFYSIGVVRDFDNDGKIDAFGYDYKNEKREYFIQWGDGSVTMLPEILSCYINYTYSSRHYCLLDIDNNGFTDILFYGRITGDSQDVVIAAYQMPNHKFDFQVAIPKSGYTMEPEYILFRDHFNRMNINCGSNEKGILTAENTLPEAPTGLRVSQGQQGVTIEWDAARDKESSPAQMRYNISVKHKGAEGEGAYLISPRNSGKDGVPVPQPFYYPSSTRFYIPIESIPAGDYEVKVQALDAWMEAGPFSQTLEFTVENNITFDMPASTRVGKDTEMMIFDFNSSVDFDGGTVKEQNGYYYKVSWDTPGEKTVKAMDKSQKITVKAAPDGAFALPTEVCVGDSHNLTCNTPKEGLWYCRQKGYIDNIEGIMEITLSDDGMSAIFTKKGEYTVVHTVTDEFGDVEYTQDVSVRDAVVPTLDIVRIDASSGKYSFTAVPGSKEHLAYNVYKETSVAGEYVRIAENLGFDEVFTDPTSNPQVSSARYMVKAVFNDGGESAESAVHMPVHTMINRAAGSAWNLIWTRYEGRDIASYNILRGTSPSELTTIATVSGNMSSYTDIEAPTGTLYYAIETVLANASSMKKAKAATNNARSNVVSTDGARDVISAEKIEIRNSGSSTITAGETTQMCVYFIPAATTLRTVNWRIAKGSEYATVNKTGLVTALPGKGGEVTVEAVTTDGSNLSAQATVFVNSSIVLATSIEVSPTAITLKVKDTEQLIARVEPENAENDKIEWNSADKSIATVDTNGIVTAVAEGSTTVSVSTTDGSNLTAYCEVKVEKDDSGVFEIEASNVYVVTENGILKIFGAEKSDEVRIYNERGGLVYKGTEKVIDTLQQGFYIVTVANRAFKVIL